MKNKQLLFTLIIILIGVVFRLLLTQNGNFIFHMDSARDLIDVREMVELKKFRLIGPTSAIEGFYNGPIWYYLLAIPYIISAGHPYSAIIMEIILWSIGGYFLIKLSEDYGWLAKISVAMVWVTSNYIVLLTSYSFNPNPVALLNPLLIYLIIQFIKTERLIFVFLSFFLGGVFFNFEMNAGVFIPPIILMSLIFTGKSKLIKSKQFLLGSLGFILLLLPQIFFDFRHDFIMTKSIIRFLSENPGGSSYDPVTRFITITKTFYEGLIPTFFNSEIISKAFLLLLIMQFYRSFRSKIDSQALVCISFIIVPLIGYTLIPVKVNSWHLGLIVTSAILLTGYLIKYSPKILSILFSIGIVIFGAHNLTNFFQYDLGKRSDDPSGYINEISAIDKTYILAEGKSFKVYTYLPSVYDFPFQYLYFWHGLNTYGYLPEEYTYAPNKPPYVPSQDKFQKIKPDLPRSDLVFLIVSPQDKKLQNLWYNHFKDYQLIESQIVGPLVIETRLDPNPKP